MTRVRVALIVLAGVLAVTLVVGSALAPSDSSSGPPTAAERTAHLAGRVRCPTCSGLSVGESDAPAAESSRIEIDRRVALGESDTQIENYFVSRYGPQALVTPEPEGFGLIVWLAPLGLAVVAAAGAGLAVRRWMHTTVTDPSAEDVALVEEALRNR